MNKGIDKNIGVEPPNDGSIALFIGYIIIGVVVTFGLLSVGMCALYCRRQYKKHFLDVRKQEEAKQDENNGRIYFGNLYKDEHGEWQTVESGGRSYIPND